MYTGLLHTHSSIRYLVLLLLIAVIIKSLIGLMNKKPFEKADNMLSLFLLIFTHIQFLAGLALYFVSPFVQFGGQTMSDKMTRYWTVEHITGMLIAVVLITIARSTSKRMSDPVAKHKRLFIFNTIALVIIIAVVLQGGLKIIGSIRM
ncbi:cytochrome B [Ohtaekwangia kribbensis]|jgi:peptidoglycan/LPS O-acetylase OafA/YrhL|uniref:Cytochrome B n=1 Tax=Ohtaekwangia kribbensis TaxID=688913 RepID=A0ABW3K4Q3_9BACT